MKFLVETIDVNDFDEFKRTLLRFQNKKDDIKGLRQPQLVIIRTDYSTSELAFYLGVPVKKLQQVTKERRLDYLQKFEVLAKNDRGASFLESDTESDNSFNRTITEALDVLEKSMSVIGNKFKNIDESTENFKPILKGTENSSTPRKPIMDLKTEKESTLK